MRITSLLMGVIVAVLSADIMATALPQAPNAAGPLTIVAAKRGKAYSSPSRMIQPRDQAADVVILLRVTGLTRDEFRSIDQTAIYVMAGTEQLPPSVVATGAIDGKPEMLLVLVGPKATLGMTLHLGRYPPVAFTAEAAIAEELN